MNSRKHTLVVAAQALRLVRPLSSKSHAAAAAAALPPLLPPLLPLLMPLLLPPLQLPPLLPIMLPPLLPPLLLPACVVGIRVCCVATVRSVSDRGSRLSSRSRGYLRDLAALFATSRLLARPANRPWPLSWPPHSSLADRHRTAPSLHSSVAGRHSSVAGRHSSVAGRHSSVAGWPDPPAAAGRRAGRGRQPHRAGHELQRAAG